MSNNSATDRCSNCGQPASRVVGNYLFRESGLSNVVLKNIEIVKCAECGNQDPVIPRLADVMGFLTTAVAKQPCRLSGEQIRFLRKQLDMGGETFARLVGVDKTTLSKWENGQIAVGATSDRLIRVVALSLAAEDKAEMQKAIRSFVEIDPTRECVRLEMDAHELTINYV